MCCNDWDFFEEVNFEVEIFISSNRKISVIANFLQDSTNKETEELYHLQNNV